MSLESWAEGMLDKSFFARAVRKSTAKSVVLGWLDAIQNPNAVLSEMAGVEAQSQGPPAPPAEKAFPPTPANPAQPVTLPRPMLLAMPANESADEPDRPGVPPKKVRKQKKQPSTNGEAQTSPSDTSPGEVPE